MGDKKLRTSKRVDRIVELVLDLIFSGGSGAVVGALFGAFFLPGLWAGLRSFVGWGPDVPSRLNCVLLAAIAGAIVAFRQARAKTRRRNRTRRVSQDLGLRYSSDADAELEDRLREMFDVAGFVDLENIVHKESESAKFLVGDVNWSEARAGSASNTSTSRTVRQTIAYFESDGLRLPEFLLQPESWLLNMFCSVAGLKEIDFDEHPEFSRAYHLSGVRADRTRRLFNRPLLEYFHGNRGWEVRGQGNRLVLCRPGKQYDPQELPEFVRQALEVFRRFQEAAAEMADSDPEDETDVDAVAETAPGLVRAIVQRHMVTRGDLDAFLDQPPLRKIPANIRRQRVASGSLVAALFGGLFTIVGSIFVIASGLFSSGPENGTTVFAVVIGFPLASVGLCMLVMALRYRRLNIRLLRHGIVAKGFIEAVQRTELTVNHERRYRVSIRFEADGSERIERCGVYGRMSEEARRCAQQRVPVRVLYDGRNPRRILWAESLITVR